MNVANRLASMTPRHGILFPAVAERYQGNAVTVRSMMVAPMETGRT